MNSIESVERGLLPYKRTLANHDVYGLLSEVDDIRIFMEKHVFAVWDFMSLLKSLQSKLTCISIPWKPVSNPGTARFINEIVLGEETDVDENGLPDSHFEMYIKAMEEVDANTSKILDFIGKFDKIYDYSTVIESTPLKPSEKSFLSFTFKTILSGETHKIASAFTFGREDLIPDMFMGIIKNPDNGGLKRFPKLKYYLDRHIELDGDEHGPLSLQMIRELCGNDQKKWDDVLETAKEALTLRIHLWDEIADEIKKVRYIPN